MDKINQKIEIMHEALKTLESGIALFKEFEIIRVKEPTEKNEQIYLSTRDSVIQRFEYCTDLFWKLLKVYLEIVEKVSLSTVSLRGIIRETVKTKIITEVEGELCIEMIESRNQTFHIYHVEIAESIAHKIPKFYLLMKKISDMVSHKIPQGV